MAARYWLHAAKKDVISWQFPAKAVWSNNILNLLAIRYTFSAYERLKREQHINTLFRTGKAFSVFPIKVLWLLTPIGDEKSPARIGFSVPKKKFRKSVHRHRITRLMREAYRLNKHELYTAIPVGKQLHLFFIFTDTTLPDINVVTTAVLKGIAELKSSVSRPHWKNYFPYYSLGLSASIREPSPHYSVWSADIILPAAPMDWRR